MHYLPLLIAFIVVVSTPAFAQETDWKAFFERTKKLEKEKAYNQLTVELDSLLSLDGLADSLAAKASYRRGRVSYMTGENATAKEYFVRAKDFYAAHPGRYVEDLNHVWQLLGASACHGGEYEEALDYLQKSLILIEETPGFDQGELLFTLRWLAYTGMNMRDQKLAMDAVESILKILRSSSGFTAEQRHHANYIIGNVYESFSQPAKGLQYGKRALRLAEQMGDLDLQFNTHNFLGLAYKQLGRRNEEVASMERAADLAQQSGNALSAKRAYHNLAHTMTLLGNYNRAEEFLEKTWAYVSQSDSLDHAFYFVMKAFIKQAAGDRQATWKAYNNTLLYVAGDVGEMHGEHYFVKPESARENFFMLQEVYNGRANAHLLFEEYPDALNDLDYYLKVTDFMAQRSGSGDSRRFFATYQLPRVDAAMQILDLLYDKTSNPAHQMRGLGYSEALKAYSLLFERQDRETEVLSARKKALLEEIALHERSADRDSVITVELLRMKLRRLETAEAQPPVGAMPPLDTTALRRWAIDGDRELLEYYVGQDVNYLFHLDRKGKIFMYLLMLPENLVAMIDEWKTDLQAASYRSKTLRSAAEQQQLDATVFAAGRELQRILLPDTLLKKGLGSRLTIVADGAINYLPFTALPIGGTDETPVWLGGGRDLTRAYSVRHQQELERNGEVVDTEYNLLAIAPTFSGTASVAKLRSAVKSRRGSTLRSGRLPVLAPLTYNVEEVDALSNIIPATLTLTGEEARRQNFFSRADEGKIIHFATHGMMDPSDPNLSFVAFSQTGETVSPEEMLYFNDLSVLPITAELVTLSACETSTGTVAPGDNILSMSSAFAAAGARSTLTTLWQVDDEATREFMVRFYEVLVAGESRGAALAEAQRYLREDTEFKHPYYWAGFVLHGADGPVVLSEKSDLNPWFLGGLLAAGLGFGLLFGLRRKG